MTRLWLSHLLTAGAFWCRASASCAGYQYSAETGVNGANMVVDNSGATGMDGDGPACCAACSSLPNCAAIVRIPDQNRCYLKIAGGSRTTGQHLESWVLQPPQDGAIIEMTGDDPKLIFGTLEDPTCQLSVDRLNSRLVSTCSIQDSRRLEETFDCEAKYAALEQKYEALQSEVSELRQSIDALKMTKRELTQTETTP